MARPDELRVRFAKIFDEKPDQTIADEIKRKHGALGRSNFSQVPQNNK